MKDLLKKLNYKGQLRIAVLNTSDEFRESLAAEIPGVIIDREIDQRCPYEFIIVFAGSVGEVEHWAPVTLHNLTADGVLWFCFHKKSSPGYQGGPDRDHGWKALNDAGFHGIRLVSVDNDWSAMRFRNIKYIKSASGRFHA